MTSLDSQIRAHLDKVRQHMTDHLNNPAFDDATSHPVWSDAGELAGAVQAVLAECAHAADNREPMVALTAGCILTAIARALGVTQETPNGQCLNAVPSQSLSAPERCALEDGHEGECQP